MPPLPRPPGSHPAFSRPRLLRRASLHCPSSARASLARAPSANAPLTNAGSSTSPSWRVAACTLARALAFSLSLVAPGYAQQADTPPKPPPPKSRAFKSAASDNPFANQVVPWFSLSTPGASLIRPGPQGSLDLAAREDQTYITVYGKKKVVDPRPEREHDYSAATWSDVGLPKDIPIGPPGNCSSGAYRTIGGQAATGADLMGGLGGGRC